MKNALVKRKMFENKHMRGLSPQTSFCLAPTAGLYFNADGSIGSCCYNRVDIFGRYPQVTVAQAWDSAVRAQMVSDLKNNSFPVGCARCKSEICKAPQVSTLATRFDNLEQRVLTSERFVVAAQNNGVMAKQVPMLVEFELGTICNLECQMCNGWVSSSIRKNREKLPALRSPYDDAFVEQLRPFAPYFRDVRFLGGEPFLNRLNFKVWDLLIELKCKTAVSITTNASVLSPHAKRVITKLKPWMVVSLDSINPQNYEKIRKNSSFSDVMKNIKWMIKHGHLKGIAACVMPNNCFDMPDLVNFCNENGLEIWFNTVFEPFEYSLSSMSKQELLVAQQFLLNFKISKKYKRGTKEIFQKNTRVYCSLTKQILALVAAKPSKELAVGAIKQDPVKGIVS